MGEKAGNLLTGHQSLVGREVGQASTQLVVPSARCPRARHPTRAWRAKTSSRQASQPLSNRPRYGSTHSGATRGAACAWHRGRSRGRRGLPGARLLLVLHMRTAWPARSSLRWYPEPGGRALDVMVVHTPGWAPSGWCHPGENRSGVRTRRRAATCRMASLIAASAASGATCPRPQRRVTGVTQRAWGARRGLGQPWDESPEIRSGMLARKPIPTAWWLRPVKKHCRGAKRRDVQRIERCSPRGQRVPMSEPTNRDGRSPCRRAR